MFCKCLIFMSFVSNSLLLIEVPDCTTYGRSCIEDKACCAGCCLKGICRDKYLECRKPHEEDPCLHRHCPEGQVCLTYQPPGCVGCSSLPECRTAEVPEELKRNKTLTHYHLFNSVPYSAPSFVLLIPVILLFVLL